MKNKVELFGLDIQIYQNFKISRAVRNPVSYDKMLDIIETIRQRKQLKKSNE